MVHYVTDAEELCNRQISLIGIMKSALKDDNLSPDDIRGTLNVLDSLIPDPDQYKHLIKKLNGTPE